MLSRKYFTNIKNGNKSLPSDNYYFYSHQTATRIFIWSFTCPHTVEISAHLYFHTTCMYDWQTILCSLSANIFLSLPGNVLYIFFCWAEEKQGNYIVFDKEMTLRKNKKILMLEFSLHLVGKLLPFMNSVGRSFVWEIINIWLYKKKTKLEK